MTRKLTDEQGVRSRGCIICGEDNPVGLQLDFTPLGNEGARVALKVPERFQGFDGIVHGGVIAALLDDVMWWAIYHTHQAATMTAEMTVRYHHPITTDQAIVAEGRVLSARGRLYRVEGRLFDDSSNGETLLAEAHGSYLVPQHQ